MNLVPRFLLGDLDLTDYPFAVEFGAQYGSPENVTEVLNSLLADGEPLSSTRTSNREIALTVIVEGSDMLALAEAEATLVREASRPANTLTIDPGDGFGVPTVFDTFRAVINFDRNDRHEGALVRRFELTIPALPYGRSGTLTTEVAEGIPSVGTVVNAGTSTTGWSTPIATVPGPTFGEQVPANPQPVNMVAIDEAAVAAKAYEIVNGKWVTQSGEKRQVRNSLALTQAIDLTTGAYLSFEVKIDLPFGRTLTSYFGETYQDMGVLNTFTISAGSRSRTYKKVRGDYSDRYLFSQGIIQALADGFTRYTFRIDEAMAITALAWTADQLVPYTEDPNVADRPRIKVRNVAVAETTTLGQQVLKTLDVGGSARTTGAIHVAAPADNVALGQVLAYTVPASKVATGFRPDLRQWAATYGPAVGGRQPITGGVLEMPASLFASGAYTVVVDQYATGSGTAALDLTAAIRMGGQVVSSEQTTLSWQISASQMNTWRMFSTGTIYLPPAAIQFPSAGTTVRLTFTATLAYLYNIYVLPTEGDLTIIDCGTGTVGPTASSHLWIDSPSPEQPQGGYWRGTTPTRQDAVAAWSSTTVPGVHTFDAGQMLAFVASTAAQGPSVSFDYHKRWFAHAAE